MCVLQRLIDVTPSDKTDDEYRLSIKKWEVYLQRYVQVGLDIQKPLLHAASRRLLSDEILSGIGARMELLDRTADYLHHIGGDPVPTEKW